MSVTTTELEAQCPCPACGALLDACTGDEALVPGSVMLCAYCTVFLVWTDGRTLRVLLDGEWIRFPYEFRRYLTTIRERYRADILPRIEDEH